MDKHSFWKQVPSQSIQNITERIEDAYKRFFDYVKGKTKLKAGPPRFKSVRKYKSYTLKGVVGYKIKDNEITLNKRKYRFWLSRPLDGIVRTVIVKRDNIGDFYICVSLDQECPQDRVASGKSVGIDFGMKTFLTLSDSTKVESPLCHLKNLPKQRLLNRSLSRKKRGSNGRANAKLKLAKLHIKTANQRRDYFHKLSTILSTSYDNIFMEDLNIKAMQKIWGRKISDLAFSEFVEILEHKGNVTKIDRHYPSSKTCSSCGHVKESLSLKTREFNCTNCGLTVDRDLNAAINIKRVGASTLAREVVSTASAA